MTMTGKGSKKPGRWDSYNRTELKAIVADGGNGADAVQVKIQRAQMLLEKLINCELFLVERNISYKWIDRNKLHNEISYLTQKGWDGHLKAFEQTMKERYYEHHGRVIKKHLLIREQDDIIRTLRLKMVHQRNSLAGEKKLIKDLRLAEETRANIVIVAKDITNNCNYEEDKKRIEISRAEQAQRRMAVKVNLAQIVKLDKEIKFWEEELMKINKMKEEIEHFISLYGDAASQLFLKTVKANLTWHYRITGRT
ncbi:unnamed protein product [Rhodiola kirilowii]